MSARELTGKREQGRGNMQAMLTLPHVPKRPLTRCVELQVHIDSPPEIDHPGSVAVKSCVRGPTHIVALQL